MLRSVNKTLSAGTNELTHSIGNQRLWLLGANLEVTDSNGNPKRNVAGSIWTQHQGEANTLSLAHGNLRNGQIAGFGCLPLQMGQKIVGKIYHAEANDNGKLNVYLVTDDEAEIRGIVLSPTWQARVDAIPSIPVGKLKIVNVTGAPDATTIDLRPDDGYLWDVLVAWGWHDSDNAETVQWRIYDGTLKCDFELTAGNVAALTKIPIYATYLALDAPSTPAILTLSYDVYAQFEISTPSAGEKPLLQAFVREYCE